ncbi:F-box/FBD/LRR-repeat protein [Tanacetum coccineum]
MKVQRLSSDILSTLPENIIDDILTRMPIRDAVRTSILSRKWRFCWTSISKLVFDDKLVKVSPKSKQLKKYKLVSAIFHVLLRHTGSILEFNIDVGELEMYSELDQIIYYLSKSNSVKKLSFEISKNYRYKLPSLFFSLQGLKSLELLNCGFEPPLTFNGFSRLKRVKFIHVEMNSKTLQQFLSNCPLLQTVLLFGHGSKKDSTRGNKFTFVELFECAPLIWSLSISGSYVKYLATGGMSQKLPTSFANLEYLLLILCLTDQDEISSALCLIRNSPNLKKLTLKFEKSDGPQISMNYLDFHDYSAFNFDYLENLAMINFSNLDLELEFVKLIMAKSPVLEKVQIELNEAVSVAEELKIFRDFVRLPFPRASPSAITIIERRKASS